MAIRNDDFEFPASLCFVIKTTSIRDNKRFRSIRELKRNIFRRSYSKRQSIAIRVRSLDIANTRAARPIATISLLFSNLKFLVVNDRVIVFVGNLDRNLELSRSKRTRDFRRFSSSVVGNGRIDNVFLLDAVIQSRTGLYFDRCILVAQFDDFERAVESRVVTTRNIH